MSRFDIGRYHFKASHNLSSCNAPRARNLIVSFLMTLLDGQHIRQYFL